MSGAREHIAPPRLATKLLHAFLRDDLAEEVQGDLEEKFYSAKEGKPVWRAKLNYWYEVINYVRPFAIKKSRSGYLNHYTMFENYFKISWRNLSRNKVYSSIKIGGFAVGIAACLLIALFIRQELSYDLHYKNGDRIYRVTRETRFRGADNKGVHFPLPFTDVLIQEYPGFEKAGRYNAPRPGVAATEVRRPDKTESTLDDGFAFMDQSVLEILECRFIYGSAQHALTEPQTMVITEKKATHYFPGEDPIGKDLVVGDNEYKITGVIENFPVTSHFQFEFLMPVEVRPGEEGNWRSSNYINYVLLRQGTDPAEMEKNLANIQTKYFLPAATEGGGDAQEIDWVKSMRFKLQPVGNIHLDNDIYDNLKHGDTRNMWLFGAIAVFILLIACINFINLSTAKSANRAREVGLRKVVGSTRGSLIRQFLTEALMFSFLSFAIGILLAWLLLPFYNEMLAQSISFPWKAWWLYPVVGIAAMIVGAIAGVYPSFYLSAFKPSQVLKGNLSRGSKNSTTRSALLVFQFAVSIVLIVATLVINRQMKYINNKKLGFDKDQIVRIQGTGPLNERIVAFKNELLELSSVENATISSFFPIAGSPRNGGSTWREGMTEKEYIGSQHWLVDHDYVKTMGLKILRGRDFSIKHTSDSQAVVINQSLAKALNMAEPIGQQISTWDGKFTVIGVVEDFHFESLRQNITPLALRIGRSRNSVFVKVKTSDMPVTIETLNTAWKKFSDTPLRYTFLDDSYARMYDDVKRTGTIFSNFAVLAIIVACLGLFALSAFMVEQRNKEISIRLVLGASVGNIFHLLTMNFVKLIFISMLIAFPLSLYLTREWLQEFAYKTQIGWEVFVLAGGLSLFIALFTISYQSILAAVTNPLNSLRSE